jgi:hemerythrin
VRGKHDDQSVYEVFDADPPTLRVAKKNMMTTFQKALAHYHQGDYAAASESFSACLREVPDDNAAGAYLQRCQAHLRDMPNAADNMLEFPWQSACSLGIESIDNAHRDLLTVLDTLRLTIANPSLAVPLLAQLQTAANECFLLEEKLMRKHHYPFTAMHLRQHQRFFESFQNLHDEIANGIGDDPVYAGFLVRNLLGDWLINHILNADRHFAHHLLGRNISSPDVSA